MNAPLLSAERREARCLARCAVTTVFNKQLGRGPRRSEPLYSLERDAWLVLISAIEQQLGITFTDEDIEFVETETDLVERGAVALMRSSA